MRFRISREALIRPLQLVTGVVEKRQTLAILSNILVKVEGHSLTVTGSDLEVELQARTTIEEGEDGEITLPARKVMDIVRTLPEEALIDVKVEGDRAVVRSGKSRFTLATLSAAEFPSTDPVNAAIRFSIPQQKLKELIERTQFSMANQDVRYYLNGLLLEIDNNKVRAVATDGHRLALSEVQQPLNIGESRQVIVPRKGVVELGRLLDEGEEGCEVALSTNQLQLVAGTLTFTSKLVDGRFPDYERVVPRDGTNIVVADRPMLRQALSRAAILSNEKYRGIRIQLEQNLLRAMVHNPEQEEAVEELEVQYEGEPLEIGFNVSYVLDALNAVREEQVELALTDSNSSCLIRGVDNQSSLYVVMPMRL